MHGPFRAGFWISKSLRNNHIGPFPAPRCLLKTPENFPGGSSDCRAWGHRGTHRAGSLWRLPSGHRTPRFWALVRSLPRPGH